MSRFSRNIIANFGGQATATIIAFATVPFYLRYLGAEAFGLAGFLLSMQAIIAVLDFGLSTAANREISRRYAQKMDPQANRNLVRTLEYFYFGVAGVILLAGVAAAAPLAESWLKSSTISPNTVRVCLILGIASIALKWPVSLYQGLLRGLEHQVELNLLNAITVVVRGAGTILILVFVSRTVEDFFWWQLAFSLAELVLFASRTWKYFGALPTSPVPRFEFAILQQLWGYSARVGGLSFFAIILKQLDKVLISRLLSIEHLGYYNAASLASNGLSKVVQPVQAASFPRLTYLHARNEHKALAALFHRSCQTTAFLVCPCACVLLFFAKDILLLWTQNPLLALEAAPTLTVLAAAMLMNCQMNVPFALQLAAGMTWLPLLANAIGALVLGPSLYWLISTFGLKGAAYAWFLFNFVNIVVVPPLTFRRLLPGEYWQWLFQDVLPFIAASLACFGMAHWAVAHSSIPIKSAAILVAGLVYVLVAGLSHPAIRRSMQRMAAPVFTTK